jgi:Na+/H+-dicarboxylate symporter
LNFSLPAGVIAGAFMPATDHGVLGSLASVVEALGAAWVRGLRMNVLPLVVSLLVVAISLLPRDVASAVAPEPAPEPAAS